MTEKVKPTWGGRASQKQEESNCLKYNTKTPAKQVPIPGTALSAFLRKYRRELLECELTHEISRTLDCVDQLLIIAERGRS